MGRDQLGGKIRNLMDTVIEKTAKKVDAKPDTTSVFSNRKSACASVVLTVDNCGTILTDANGCKIRIIGYVHLDVQIKMEGVRNPVIVKGMRLHLAGNKQ